MGMPKYATKRDTVENEIFDALRQCGVDIYPTDKPFDAIAGFRGLSYLVEIKDPKKKGWKNEFTQDQLDFMSSWRGSPVVVLRSVEDAIKWINSIEK